MGRIRCWLEEKWGIRWHQHKERGIRMWIYVRRGTITLERYWGNNARNLHIGLDLGRGDADREITFSLGIKRLFDFYFSFDHPWLERITPGEWRDSRMHSGKRFKMARKTFIGVRVFGGAVWVSLWENTMEWNSSDPWWWAFSFKPVDFFLGVERIVNDRDLQVMDFSVRLPEGKYDGRCRLYHRSWKRSRWPITRRLTLYTIDLVEPIPVPGKGESAWDIGEDAIYSISGSAESVNQAVIRLLNAVNRARIKYGGPAWMPKRRGSGNGTGGSSV